MHGLVVTIIAVTAVHGPTVTVSVTTVMLGSCQEWQRSSDADSFVLPLQEVISSCIVRHGM